MSRGRRDLTADEKKLWRRVAVGVKSRRAHAPAEPEEPSDSPERVARTTPKPVAMSLRVKPAPAPQHRGNEKRVRRGNLEIDAVLDLHGYTQQGARAALARFLRAAQARGDRALIVVTGVGRGGEGVLKQRLPEWLAEPAFRSYVSGYAPAHRAHGGAGAFYVFVRRSE